MQLAVQPSPGVWVYAQDASYNEMRPGGYAAFFTPDQQVRLEALRQARMLYAGQHRAYYLDEARTQFDFPPMLVGSAEVRPYLRYNALGLISTKGTDLLLGSEATFKSDVPAQQDALHALADRSNLHQLFYSAARDASYEREAFVEAVVFGGEVYLKQVPADEIFPVGPLRADMQYGRYDRYGVRNVGTDDKPILVVLVTSYLPGFIVRKLYQLDERGTAQWELSLDQWPLEEDDAPLVPVVNTGIAANTIVWVPNGLDGGRVVGDYDIAVDLQDALNAKQTQLARVIAKHADPKIALPTATADAEGNVANRDAFFFRTPDEIPRYLVWNAELAAAMTERDAALYSLLIATETSPVLLGLKEGGQHDAYKKVKVQAMSALKKAERKSVYWTVGIRRALTVAQDLEQTLPGVRYGRGPIGVSLDDGIPIDELDQANIIATLRGAGVLPLRMALEQLYADPAVVEAALAELAKEAAAATPSIFMGRPMPGTTAGDAEVAADELPEARAGEADARAEVAA